MSDEIPHTHEELEAFSKDLGETIVKAQSELPGPLGSASSSADEWGNVGRKALENAMAATRDGNFGTAHDYRKTAEVAFAYEVKLRTIPNDKLTHPAVGERGNPNQ